MAFELSEQRLSSEPFAAFAATLILFPVGMEKMPDVGSRAQLSMRPSRKETLLSRSRTSGFQEEDVGHVLQLRSSRAPASDLRHL